MTPELQKYYEDRLSMCSTQAWKDLIEDIDKIIESTSNINAIDSLETLKFRQGELSILNWIKGLQTLSNDAYEDLKRESDD